MVLNAAGYRQGHDFSIGMVAALDVTGMMLGESKSDDLLSQLDGWEHEFYFSRNRWEFHSPKWRKKSGA